MRKPKTDTQYSWDEGSTMADYGRFVSTQQPLAANSLKTADSPTFAQQAVAADADMPASAPAPGDAVMALFGGAIVGTPATSSSSAMIASDVPSAAAEVSAAAEAASAGHASGCGCEACALPGVEGPPATASGTGMQNAAGPSGTVIEAGVDLGAVQTGGIGIANGDTFKLHSNPGSKFTVYLDFNGHTTTGTSWNGYWGVSSFYSSAFSLDAAETFSAPELLRIQQIWQRMAEYFSPFNINVTTQDPGTAALMYGGTGDTNGLGIRVVITDEGGKSFGGIAYVGSFDWNSDTPTYVYANRLTDSAKNIADAAAHEVGHSLGLAHDGRTVSEYYSGHGSGATDWAPTMGVGYNANIVQWSNGSYNGATTTQDDLSIITTQNSGVAYRADDHGNTFATASALGGTVTAGIAAVSAYGVISGSGARNDVDMFKFTLGAGGAIDFTISSWSRAYVAGSSTPIYTASPFSMLDVALKLYDGAMAQVASFDDIARIDGVVKLSGLAAGTYYLALDGVGWGTPDAATPTGYTEYGSLGQYMIRGTYSAGGSSGGGGGSTESGTGGGSTGGGTTGGGGGSTDPGVTPTFSVDRTTLTMLEGGADSIVISADGVTGDVIVNITGAPAGFASLSASQIVLSAANDWTATLRVSSLGDRDVRGDSGYTLQLAAADFATVAVAVTSKENDIAPATAVKGFGSYSTAVGNQNGTIAAVSRDDTSVNVLREGILSTGGAGLDVRWQFNKLTPGTKLVQLDAFSAAERFRFEYSTDNAVTWRGFTEGPGDSLAWKGNYAATGIDSNLWVRAVDAVRIGDTVRDTITVDLMTLATPSTLSTPADSLL